MLSIFSAFAMTALAVLPQAPEAPKPAWSATTLEAAATDANKAVLKKGKAVTVTGEVVDLSCYIQLGKRGEGHKACGTKCVANGAPVGLVTKENKVYMLVAEQHHPRRDGQLGFAKEYAGKMATIITVSGMLSEYGGIPTLFVEAPMAAK
ncbi:MAG: hypothetical protein KGN80_09290 [Acidobacteriota bacterium]|nr:hypothetical protein [Acidobacteriota bacterium]